jgi:hypothetical protein
MVQADDISAILTTENPYITIIDNSAFYGNILPEGSVQVLDAYTFSVDNLIPDHSNLYFTVEATDGSEIWTSQFLLFSHAPMVQLVDFAINDSTGNNNGRIDPGETVELNILLHNSGTSGATGVTAELFTDSPDIGITTGTQDYGSLDPGMSNNGIFTIVADGSISEGTQVQFYIDITADGGISFTDSLSTVIGRYAALVLDLEPMNYSGPEIYNTLGEMDIFAHYANGFPANLEMYKNVFVCLGIQFWNYELSGAQGQQLKDFLLSGGNLYMEGRVTWDADPHTPVHPMFNVDVIPVPQFIINGVVGISGTFAEGMHFGYEGFNALNDYSLEPLNPAFCLFNTDYPFWGCMVANNMGLYHTIGSSVEFGQLTDDSPPSTKKLLMEKMLNWFDGVLTNAEFQASEIDSENMIIAMPNPFSEKTTISFILDQKTEFRFEVYNLHGEKIKTFERKKVSDNRQDLIWDGSNNEGVRVNPGVYFGVLRTENYTETIKLLITM